MLFALCSRASDANLDERYEIPSNSVSNLLGLNIGELFHKPLVALKILCESVWVQLKECSRCILDVSWSYATQF